MTIEPTELTKMQSGKLRNELELGKITKNTVMYKSNIPTQVVRNIYIAKEGFPNIDFPHKIVIAVDWQANETV